MAVLLVAVATAAVAVAGLSVEPGAALVKRGDALRVQSCAPQDISLAHGSRTLAYEVRPAPQPHRPDRQVYVLDGREMAIATPVETRLGPGVWIYAYRRVLYNGCD